MPKCPNCKSTISPETPGGNFVSEGNDDEREVVYLANHPVTCPECDVILGYAVNIET